MIRSRSKPDMLHHGHVTGLRASLSYGLLYGLTLFFGLLLFLPPAGNDTALLGQLVLWGFALLLLIGFGFWLVRSGQRVLLALLFLTALMQVPSLFVWLSDQGGSKMGALPYQFVKDPQSWIQSSEARPSQGKWTESLSAGIQLQQFSQRSCGSLGCSYRHLLASSRLEADGHRRFIDWIATDCSDIGETGCLDGIYPVNLMPGQLRHFWLLRETPSAVYSPSNRQAFDLKAYAGSYLLMVRSDGHFEPLSFKVADLALNSFLMSWLPLLAYLAGRGKSLKGSGLAVAICWFYWLVAYGNLIDLGARGSG